MNLRQAAEMALEALEEINKLSVGEKAVCLPAEIDGAMEALRQALAQPDLAKVGEVGVWGETPPCKTHPDAPHGFDRNGSHSADRYVCECEGWEPPRQEPVGYAHVEDLKREHHDFMAFWVNRQQGVNEVPLYTAPPKKEWVGLTDEERFLNDCRSPEEIEYAVAIEAKLKEKNT